MLDAVWASLGLSGPLWASQNLSGPLASLRLPWPLGLSLWASLDSVGLSGPFWASGLFGLLYASLGFSKLL